MKLHLTFRSTFVSLVSWYGDWGVHFSAWETVKNLIKIKCYCVCICNVKGSSIIFLLGLSKWLPKGKMMYVKTTEKTKSKGVRPKLTQKRKAKLSKGAGKRNIFRRKWATIHPCYRTSSQAREFSCKRKGEVIRSWAETQLRGENKVDGKYENNWGLKRENVRT